jgi:ferric-dicitrate binding protein FerR (iron transport regulator)
MQFRTSFACRIFKWFRFGNWTRVGKNERSKKSHAFRRSRAEAALWIVWLHGPDRNRDMEAGFRRWLAESPDHAAAFEAAADTYEWVSSMVGSQVRPVHRFPLPPASKSG